MKRVIADCLAGGFAHPRIEGLAQGLAFILNGKIDQRSGATESSGPGTRFKVVRTGGASEGHVEVRVDVDAPGQHEFAGGIQQLRSILSRKILTDRPDPSIRNGNIGLVRIGRGHDGTVSNDRIEAHRVLRGMRIMLHCPPSVLHSHFLGRFFSERDGPCNLASRSSLTSPSNEL